MIDGGRSYGLQSKSLLAAVTVLLLGLAWQPGEVRAASDTESISAEPTGRVFLLKGGGGGFFSNGLSKLSDKLNIVGASSSVVSLEKWREVAADILAQHAAGRPVSPLVIIGHSWGANAALLMAVELGKYDVPVDLVVTFDPLDSIQVGSNVERVINFYIKISGKPVAARRDFTGVLENFNVADLKEGIWHPTIDDNEGLQKRAIEAVLREFQDETGATGSR